jgi:hypothetical protein
MKKNALLVLSIVLSMGSFAQSDTVAKRTFSDIVQFKGYVKNMQTITLGRNTLITDNLIHNRLNFKLYPTKQLTIGLEARNRIIWGETMKATPGYASYFDVDNGFVDMSFNIAQNNNAVFNSTIDRAYINWAKGNWAVRAGRQRINWGINTFWNANDIFNAYNFTDFDYEERAGSDAIKVERYFNGMSSVQVAVSQGAKSNSTVAGMLYKFNKRGYDFQVLTGWYKTDYVLGGGWAGNIKDASFKGEITYFQPAEKMDSLGVLNASVSTDIIHGSKYFSSWGVLFNSNGVTDISRANSNLLAFKLSSKALMPTKYNLLTSHMFTLSPLTSLSVIVLYSPAAHYTLLMPSFTYSLAQTWDLSLVAQSSFADIGRYINIGNAFFVRLKWSF